MSNIPRDRKLSLTAINEQVLTDPQAFVKQECERYNGEVFSLAEKLTDTINDHLLVMMCGPSSAGKTTTATKLQQELQRRGIDTHIVSLDNFYLGRGMAPKLPDGSFDYEALEALDVPQLQTCMKQLLTDGVTLLPEFDFVSGKPVPDKVEMCIKHGSVVIFEGIHALNPVLEQQLPRQGVFNIFINSFSPIYEGSRKLLKRRDLRLMRRTLRDEQFRNSSPENTFTMWQQVVRGEMLYMFPYIGEADALIDTVHAFEPCVLRDRLLPLLLPLVGHTVFGDTASQLTEALQRFVPLDDALVPADCMLREFLGAKED